MNTCAYAFICTQLCIGLPMNVICIYHVYIFIYIHTYIHTYIYIYTYIYTYIHIYIYIYIVFMYTYTIMYRITCECDMYTDPPQVMMRGYVCKGICMY